MAPPKHLPKTVESDNALLTDFFKRKRKGRPRARGNTPNNVITVEPHKKKKRGPIPMNKGPPMSKKKKFDASSFPTNQANHVAMANDRNKQKRVNYGQGFAKENLEQAIMEWDKKCGRSLHSNGEERSMECFAGVIGIPYNTFQKYSRSKVDNRRDTGQSVGKISLITKENQGFVADVLARKDRGNDGSNREEAIDLVHDLLPHLNRRQARQSFTRTLLPNHPTVLKPKTVKAQATTTKRSAITVEQQFRWMETYNKALSVLRSKNSGTCRKTGKMFGELIQHFVFGGDETCFQACPNGDVRIIGSSGRKKHEVKTQDSRVSITMYRTGNIAGTTGPTVFLLEGKHRRVGYTDKWLMDNGAAAGSTIVMTPTAFMTEQAWEAMTPSVIKGLRSASSIVNANPQWWVLEVFDGFGPHTSSLSSMQMRFDNKILSLKEEGDSSHVNQAYDNFVAVADKKAKTESLGMLRGNIYVSRGVVCQWGMIHVGLYAIRATLPDTWTNSFHACNMDPRTSLSFPDWCKKIQHFLQAGQSFVAPVGPINKYAMLPSFWHGMTPYEKKKVIATIDLHVNYSIACSKALYSECHIPYSDQQNIRVCYDCAKECPDQLEMGLPTTIEVPAEARQEVLEAKAAATDATDGLNSFILKPPGLTGIDLFSHMVQKRLIDPKSKDKPSCYLAIDLDKSQLGILAPTSLQLNKREIMRYAGGTGASMKMAARKLDQFGYIKSYSGLANDPARLSKLANQLMLAKSVASIAEEEKRQARQKKTTATTELFALAPEAKKKLANKLGDVNKLTKKEISALLLVCYLIEEDEKRKKGALVAILNNSIEKDPTKVAVEMRALPSL